MVLFPMFQSFFPNVANLCQIVNVLYSCFHLVFPYAYLHDPIKIALLHPHRARIIFWVPILLLGLWQASGCEEVGPGLTTNSVLVSLDGQLWQSVQTTGTYQPAGGDEVTVRIIAKGTLNELIYIQFRARESQLFGNHPITVPALGNFLGYTQPGAPAGIETHSSFQCGFVSGSIQVDELSLAQRYVTGRFEGTVCRVGGQEPLSLLSGEFYRVNF